MPILNLNSGSIELSNIPSLTINGEEAFKPTPDQIERFARTFYVTLTDKELDGLLCFWANAAIDFDAYQYSLGCTLTDFDEVSKTIAVLRSFNHITSIVNLADLAIHAFGLLKDSPQQQWLIISLLNYLFSYDFLEHEQSIKQDWEYFRSEIIGSPPNQ